MSATDVPQDHGAMVGFDANGKLRAVAWLDPKGRHGMTEKQARRDMRADDLASKIVTTDEVRALMLQHNFMGCADALVAGSDGERTGSVSSQPAKPEQSPKQQEQQDPMREKE